MLTVTQRLLDLDPTLKAFNEGEWNQDNELKAGFHSFNDAGIECETGEFLYAMVRLLQPQNVLETGTHWGVGASYMGMALKDNGFGHLDTVEFLPEIHARARQRINQLQLEPQVTCHYGDVANFQPTVSYRLILLDTEPQTRFAEMAKFWENLEEGGFLFIHDLHPHMHQIDNADHGFAWPYGEVTDFMKELVRSGKARPFHFRTPRGFTGFYKVSKDDYKWPTLKGDESIIEQMQAVGH